MLKIASFMALVAFTLTACAPGAVPSGGGSNAPVKPLTGTGWQLVTLNDQPTVPNTVVTADFGAAGKLSGSAGCNSYNTTYTTNGDNITINPQIATTMMACPDPIMQQETTYLQTLPKAAKYQIAGDDLTLRDAGGTAIATYHTVSQSLSSTSWDVISYNNGKGGVVSVINGTQLTALFGAAGALTGSAGCNDYNATYQTNGDKITIGPAATTRKFCETPAGIMDQETQYLTALTTAATYSISGNKMEMRTAAGALAATFQRKP